MARNNHVKYDYERWAGKVLLQVLGIQAEYLRHGDDSGEPDTIFEVGGSTLGIEISTAYYSEAVAKEIWDYAQSVDDVLRAANNYDGPFPDADVQIGKRIQEVLSHKCAKHYAGTDDTWLCIVEDAPLTAEGSIRQSISSLQMPETCPFSKIYILHHEHEAKPRYDAIELL